MKHYDLSVIVTAHNCAKYLTACLNSIQVAMGDKFPQCELVLINDSSSDDTPALFEAFAAGRSNVVQYNVAFKNIGKVRNFGVSQARGDYITMVDGDDQLKPDSLVEIINFLTTNEPDMLITKLTEVRDSSSPVNHEPMQLKQITTDIAIKKYLIHQAFQAHFIGKFIKRSILLRCKFPNYICYEDAFVFPEVLKSCKDIYFSSTGPYMYFKHGNTLSSDLDEEKIKLCRNGLDQMSLVLKGDYKFLQVCHWIEFINRNHLTISKWKDRSSIKQNIEEVDTLPFLLHPAVRISYKRKLIKVKKLIRSW
ncbi:glycosyltransferase family 2 protein [Rouxiella badensis]|jgi:glycosyltransferase involved in cell wall biosynthesis|uniref:Glycosyltransferase n=1 Tax=Rouxiella badensis TaxID=1646377 RepID=A0A1X0WEB6_9GAMM|nr:glycosyltransferase family 2 protein [Rouxiella badensis]MCC3705393.1 glycosyltransferase [Rouxiella badensis]MCC3719485.1 glycosyltransferase [Rouxiella badensis]MCC3728735.1 glycosyltransferase [Rouxiella badensis]MCC3733161.1 glycosyltransferase [Rouxiella badensis]MCC3741069.1 glycosyltransferase [Rouxiella badensis]